MKVDGGMDVGVEVRNLGLVDVVKVPKTAAEAGKRIPPPKDEHGKRRTGHVFHRGDNSTEEVQLYTYADIPSSKPSSTAKRPSCRSTSSAPDASHNAAAGTAGTTTTSLRTTRGRSPSCEAQRSPVRLDRCDDDTDLKHNRAEHLRPITIHDQPIEPITSPDHESQFDQCYGPRPSAESKNSWVKHHFNWKRAPAVGFGRVHFMLICAALLKNASAALVHAERRLRQAA